MGKTLKSAIANAENNDNLRVDGLVVKEATVGEGPTIKRIMPRARGSGSPIRKRTSHIRIILTDEIEIKMRDKESASEAGGAKKKKAPPRKRPRPSKSRDADRAKPNEHGEIRKLIHGTES